MATRSEVMRLRVEVDEKGGTANLKKFTGEVSKAERDVVRAGDKIQRSFSGVERSTSGLVGSARKLMTSWRALAVAGVALGVAVAAVDRLADRADRVTSLAISFETLSRRIGTTSEVFLPKLRKASRGLASDMELIKQANNAVILGLPLTADRMAELTSVAITLGRAVGLDAASSIESLTTGIGRQSRQMLDNLGIVIDTQKAYEDYARTLGVNVKSLSASQQKQAFFNETMVLAREKVQGLDSDVLTISENFKKWGNAVTNTVDSVIDDLNRLPQTAAKTQGTIERLLKAAGQLVSSPGPGGLFSARGTLVDSSQNDILANQERQANIEKERKAAHALLGVQLKSNLEVLKQEMELQEEKTKELKKQNAEGERAIRLKFDEREETRRSVRDIIDAGFASGEGVQGPQGAVPSLPTTSIANLKEAEASFRALGDGIDEGRIAAEFAALSLSDAFIDAALGAKIAWGQFFKSLLADIAKAIIQSKLLAAINNQGSSGASSGGGGGFGFFDILSIGASAFGVSFAKGGMVGARGGLLVGGGIPGRDSVPVLAQRGEAILPPPLTAFLTRAARQASAPQIGSGAAGEPSAPMTFNVTINGVRDGADILNNPEMLARAFRNAARVGAL